MTDGRNRTATRALAQTMRGAAIACLLATGTSAACSAPQPRTGSTDARALAEYDLARDAFEHGRLREALGHVEAALRIDEENPDVHYLGAVILLQFCALDEASTDCRFSEAERHARAALAAAPDMRDAKNVLGVILVHEKRYDEAVALLKPLAEDILYASPEKAWGNLGWAYLMRGNTDEAIDALRRALAAQPLFCVGNYRLGLAYEKKGELNLAQEALTKAVETDRPECQRLQDAYAARARVLGRLNKTDDAHADLVRCRDVAPQTPTGKRCAAQLASPP
jgi:Tfp pilus assembly protein PilF